MATNRSLPITICHTQRKMRMVLWLVPFIILLQYSNVAFVVCLSRNRICYGSFSIALVYLKTHVYLRAHHQIPKYPHANINTQYKIILYILPYA